MLKVKNRKNIEFHNASTGALDTLDQMCGQMSCSQKTTRCPLCIFFWHDLYFNCKLLCYYSSNMVIVRKNISIGERLLWNHTELVKLWFKHRYSYSFLHALYRHLLLRNWVWEVCST